MVHINNKLLVSVSIPIIDQEYSVLIPINKTIGIVKQAIIDTVCSLNDIKITKQMKMIDKITNVNYDERDLVVETSIKNGTKLLLV